MVGRRVTRPRTDPAATQSEMQGIVGGKLKLKGVDKKCATDTHTRTHHLTSVARERRRLTCCRPMVMRCVPRKKKKKHKKEKEQAAAAAMADGGAMLAAGRHNQVGTVEADGSDAGQDLGRTGLRIGRVLDLDAIICEYGGFHGRISFCA